MKIRKHYMKENSRKRNREYEKLSRKMKLVKLKQGVRQHVRK